MRIAIVNDLLMAVEGLRRAVISSGKHEIVWVASNGKEAVEKCSTNTPDLVLMDLHMPIMNGVDATRLIMQANPCPILIVTASVRQNSAMVFEAMGNGALDAVNTPILSSQGNMDGQKDFLKKIDLIGILSKPYPSTRLPTDNPVERNKAFLAPDTLVLLGASSGGPQALASILRGLPAGISTPIIIVQHVDEQFAPGLADWLDQQTALKVRLAKVGDRPMSGTVLLSGTNDHLVMRGDGSLSYTPEPVNLPYRPSIDVFWHSVATYWQGSIIAALLTGMGRDGAEGMLALKHRGALTIAQNEASSAVYGMPKAARELGAALKISALETIAFEITQNITPHEAGDCPVRM